MPQLHPEDGGLDDLDVALARLEDVLLALPYDRALPDLERILEAASITSAHLRADDRTLKLLHEAIVARPLATSDAIATVRTQVELLTLEVGVLTEQLADPATSAAGVARAADRLTTVRAELDRVRRQL
jgi:hypothetical protein